jgi:hypothetical protein
MSMIERGYRHAYWSKVTGRMIGNSPVTAKRKERERADADPVVGCAVFDS